MVKKVGLTVDAIDPTSDDSDHDHTDDNEQENMPAQVDSDPEKCQQLSLDTASETHTLSTHGSRSRLPLSPWLPPPSARAARTPKPRSPLDPLQIPEPLGVVQPSFLPYATPPTKPVHASQTSVSAGKSVQKRRGNQESRRRRLRHTSWNSRHCVCDSKDNRRLPRLRRTYFDDLPHSRCQGGEYRSVPSHRSRNFDHFCAAPLHDQRRELKRRFQRYPFVEAAKVFHNCETNSDLEKAAFVHDSLTPSEPSSRSSSSSSDAGDGNASEDEASPDDTCRDSEGSNVAFASERSCVCGAALCNDARSCASCGLHRGSTRQRSMSIVEMTTLRRRSVSCRVRKYSIQTSPTAKIGLRFSVDETATLSEANDDSSPLSTSSKSRKFKKKNSGRNKPGDPAIFTRGGLLQFHSWCFSKFGGLVKLWRCLDVHNHMRIGQSQFLRGLQDLGYSGDARELFKDLNRDHTGTLLFYHFAPEAALGVGEFLHWARTNYGTLAETGICSVLDKKNFLNRAQFIQFYKKKGYDNDMSLNIAFDLMDKDGSDSVTKAEIVLLDKWEFPEWLTAKPDAQAAELVKEKLVAFCQGNPLNAWRHLDRNGTMRVAWHDFRIVCRKFLSQEVCESLASAWRALDDDLSGWLSLREFDNATYAQLAKFVKWIDESYGGIYGAFPKLVGNRDAKISQGEFRSACRSSGLGEDIIWKIFTGLDIDSTGSICMPEIRFLATWKVASDLLEEEAWASLTRPTLAIPHPQSPGQVNKRRQTAATGLWILKEKVAELE